MVDISVVVNLHNEGPMFRRTLIAARAAMARAGEIGYSCELILALDNPSADTFTNAFSASGATLVYPEAGDLGEARNCAVRRATGRYVAFCDGDDLFGREWLARAASMAHMRGYGVYHTAWNYGFGEDVAFFQEGFSFDDPRYNQNDLLQHNPWSALCFAPRDLLLKHPYRMCEPGLGIEDWRFHLDTLECGVPHYVVPQTVHLIRFKPTTESLCNTKLAENVTVGPVAYFDRRRPKNEVEPGPKAVPREVVRQTIEAQAVEPLAFVNQQTQIRDFGHCEFADGYWSASAEWPEHFPVYIASNLGRGGAERWLLNCLAVKPGVVVLTDDGPRDWVHRLPAGCALVDLCKHFGDNNDENLEILRRLLIQKRPDFIHVTTSGFGWAALSANPDTLLSSGVRKLIVSSLNDCMVDGQRVAPAYFHTPKLAKKAIFLTDNTKWAHRLQSMYGKLNMHVLHQPADSVDHLREWPTNKIAWLGRVAPDKGIDTLARVAAACPDKEFWIWGEGETTLLWPSNVKFAGPYNSTKEIAWTCYDAIVLTSKSEGMPNVVLEAAGHGLAAFTFLSAGDASLPCPMLGARDESHMVQLINRTPTDLLEHYGKEAREYVRQLHNWAQWKKEYGKICE